MSFEESLIQNAAPTLAGIKVANLYNYCFDNKANCDKALAALNKKMNPKGVYIELLKNRDDFYLIYVYRKNLLQKELSDADVENFLEEYGYKKSLNLRGRLGRLKEQINRAEGFPHEIGVFLGYPLYDVKSFIENRGDNFLACGEWKVYHEKKAAMNLFGKLNYCKETYQRIYKTGKTIEEMTVSA